MFKYTRSRFTGARSNLLGRACVLAAIAAAGSAAASLAEAAPASATIRFCTAQVCIGPPNGCSVRSSTGVVIQADDGDSFIDSMGRKWTCNHGKWTVALTSGVTRKYGPVLGGGLLTEGDPGEDPCHISEAFCSPSPPPTTSP
jgi:hypothetical protein